MTLKNPSSGDGRTLKTAGSGFSLLDITSWPTASTGQNGDYAFVRDDSREGANQMFLVGPKSSGGTWPNYGWVISRGGDSLQVISNGPLQGGSAVNNPTHYAYNFDGTDSSGSVSTDVNGYAYALNTSAQTVGIRKKSGGFAYQPVGSFALSGCQVKTLPAAGGYAGCGSSGTHPYWACTDSAGKIYLVATVYSPAVPQWGSPMASGANGDVRANDFIIYKKEGTLFTVLVLDGTTGAVRRTLNAIVGGANDQGGSQYYATGASMYSFYNDTTARLTKGVALA